MSVDNLAWVCCQCSMINFDSELCIFCGHQKCGGCHEMDEKEKTQALINAEKAKAWLIGQSEVKKSFNIGAYEKNKLEGRLEELQEEVDLMRGDFSVEKVSKGKRGRNSSSPENPREED